MRNRIEISESQLEDLIYDNIDNQDEIRMKGLDCFQHQKILRQVNLGAYGILDLIGIDIFPSHHNSREIYITIYELKKDQINANTLGQCLRYVSGLKTFLSRQNFFNQDRFEFNFSKVLIGSNFDLNSDFCFTCSDIESLEIYTYSFGLNGISFEQVNPEIYSPNGLEKIGFGSLNEKSTKSAYRDIILAYPNNGSFNKKRIKRTENLDF